jgi:fluoride exporter
MKLLWIGAGGALGSIARYLLDGAVQRIVPGSFPAGILAVNVLGSFGIGFVMSLLGARGMLDSTLRLALVAGVLGGFTTYSSFNYQLLELLRGREWLVGGAYLAATVVLGLGAGLAGLGAGRWLVSA